jgi:hypothetical protein
VKASTLSEISSWWLGFSWTGAESKDLKNFMKNGISAPNTIVVKKTKIKVELTNTCLFFKLGVSIEIASPNAIAPLIDPAQDIIPFSENFILKFLTFKILDKCIVYFIKKANPNIPTILPRTTKINSHKRKEIESTEDMLFIIVKPK